jgi:hypothetical protein
LRGCRRPRHSGSATSRKDTPEVAPSLNASTRLYATPACPPTITLTARANRDSSPPAPTAGRGFFLLSFRSLLRPTPGGGGAEGEGRVGEFAQGLAVVKLAVLLLAGRSAGSYGSPR